MISPSLRLLFATSECAPFSKTGGLADVSAALPGALRRLGVDVRILVPAYARDLADARTVTTINASANFPAVTIVEKKLPSGVPVWLLVCPEFYARNGSPYQNASGADWPDNAIRFGFLGRIAARVAAGEIPGWAPDVIHCNDWPTGLGPAYLRYLPAAGNTASVFTIHNLAFQGLFPAESVAALGLPAESFSIDGLEYYGQLSFLKAGISYADAITTVSPTYAAEIQSESLGAGLHGLLHYRRQSLTGILNGIDTVAWNPASDPNIAANYGAATLADKMHNKRALQLRAGLPQSHQPVLAVISRLTEQKGIDWIVEIAPALAARAVQLVVLGRGEERYETDLKALAAAHPSNIAVTLGFDDAYAHLIEAGADIFLMPSRFEPCGMNQMYSQRYGTVPVVRATGGLADSVEDAATPNGAGLLFYEASASALMAAIERALLIFRDRTAWRRLQASGMRREFGWNASAARYLEIYRRITANKKTLTPTA